MKARDLIEALTNQPRATRDYAIEIVRTDDEGETHDVGAVEKVEFNHETKTVIVHAVSIGC